MRKLVILEGADGVGKSTLSHIIADKWGYASLRQPTDSPPLGFIRDIVKSTDNDMSFFNRQLLHACTHIFDLIRMGDFDQNVIMDRSPYSGLAYSHAALFEWQYDIVKKVNLAAYHERLAKLFDQVVVLFVTTNDNLKPDRDEGDIYEQKLHNMKEFYETLYGDIHTDPLLKLHPNQVTWRYKNCRNADPDIIAQDLLQTLTRAFATFKQ